VSEDRALAEIKRLLERHIENPVDYLAEADRETTGAAD
jgi:hypothetical protein